MAELRRQRRRSAGRATWPIASLQSGSIFGHRWRNIDLRHRDHEKGTERHDIGPGRAPIIWRSPRLRTLFPALFLLFAGWLLALTYVPLTIAALYQGNNLGTMVGYVLGASGLVSLVLSPAVGMLADRLGHWQVLFGGGAVAVALWPIPALVPRLVGFAVSWALLSGVLASIFAISFSVLSESAPAEVRGRVMSFAFLPINVGFIVGPAIGSVITRASIFAVFPAAAAITLLGLGALLVAARQSPAPVGQPA